MKLLSGETRVEGALAICLSIIAGYLDGYGLLVFGTYVSFMSGNTTSTGLKIGQGHFDAALPFATAVASFVSGSFLGNLMTQSRLRHSHRLIFGLIAGLLATVAGLARHGPWNAPSEIAMLSVAMGMMNPALSKIGESYVRDWQLEQNRRPPGFGSGAIPDKWMFVWQNDFLDSMPPRSPPRALERSPLFWSAV